MKKKSIILLFSFVSFFCCSEKNSHRAIYPVKISRFDLALYEYLTKNNTQEEMLQEYKPLLDLLGERVIGIGTTDSTGFFERLETFFSDSSLMKLYKDEVTLFADVSNLEKEISFGFEVIQSEFDSIRIPQLYMHVSGLNRNLIVTDDFISLSADKYLGSTYKFYEDFFYDYQRQNMKPGRIVPDFLLGFLLTNFPFQGNNDILLDRMLYEGKIRYILSTLLPAYSDAGVIGYTEQQELWYRENESGIWKNILQQQHLYTSDHVIVRKYMEDAPFTAFLSDQSPGKIGVRMGYGIIQTYMRHHAHISLQELMKMMDYQEILRNSKYKP
jgi:hypothetical protein